MIEEIDSPEDIDSLCNCNPIDADGQSQARCANDATTWVRTRKGTRKYVCATHAEVVDRFGETDDHPRIVECERCYKLTPVEHANDSDVCRDCIQ